MSRSSRNGFTLTELFVVLVILVVLIALLIPATRRSVRPAAERAQCQNNLRQLMMAMHAFASTGQARGNADTPAEGSFPPGCFGPGTKPEDRLSWLVLLLPFLEQDTEYRQFDLEKGYAENLPAAQTRIKGFLCPAGKGASETDALTHYVAMAGIGCDAAGRPAGAVGNGFMGYDRRTSPSLITDGTANTIALMETRVGLGPWACGGPSTVRGFDPADVPAIGDQRPFGGHAGGVSVAMADGSVRFVPASIDPKRLAAAITIAGGEPVDWD